MSFLKNRDIIIDTGEVSVEYLKKGAIIIMSNIADKFEELGVIPVVVLNDSKDALPLAKALVEGGLPCAEVTFRTAAAEESIRLMHEAYPDMVLAAGTVLTTEQVDRAVAAGASVIVSPGFDPEIVDYCISKDIPVMPGLTITDAPAATALSTCSVVSTVPAASTISGYASCIRRIDSSAAAVRNVTSAQGSPPSTKAFAKGSASFESFNTTTGITPSSSNLSAILLIIIIAPFFKYSTETSQCL